VVKNIREWQSLIVFVRSELLKRRYLHPWKNCTTI